jgi:hypothetical protein
MKMQRATTETESLIVSVFNRLDEFFKSKCCFTLIHYYNTKQTIYRGKGTVCRWLIGA